MADSKESRVRVEGSPPEGSFILVSNHLGYADIFLLCGNLPGWYIAKSDVRSWPIMGLILRGSNVLFIDRTRRKDVVRMGRLTQGNRAPFGNSCRHDTR